MKRIYTILVCAAIAVTAMAQDMALIGLSVACMREEPKYSAELSSQVVMGTPVMLVEKSGSWWLIESPEGYRGWVQPSSLVRKTDDEMAAWRQAPRLIVDGYSQIVAYDSPLATGNRNVVTDLLPGNIVEGRMDDVQAGRVHVKLPDGREAWAEASAFIPVEVWAARDFDADLLLERAWSMMGAPYLWGGTSQKATDCSGLVKICYYNNGIILKRNASQQARTGTRLDIGEWPQLQRGDLLFFSSSPQSERVTHVGIYDGESDYVHCAGRVRQNSLDPESPIFNRGHHPLWAVRINGNMGTDGIVQVRNHPWYF